MPIPLFLVGLAKTAATVFAGTAANKLVEELTKEPSNEEIQELRQRILDEQRKRKKQVMVIGVVCFLLGLVASSVTWYVLQSSQSSQPSEQIIALEELEKYEKARDAGLQALEYYVIQNPNSPYISQAKALIRAYKGKE